MYIYPELAIEDLKDYLNKIGYTITETALKIFYDFEGICFSNNLYPFERDILLPLINNIFEFRNIIDKYGGNASLAIDNLHQYYKEERGKRDEYQVNQELYSLEGEDTLNFDTRYNIINYCINVVNNKGCKQIDEYDLLQAFLNWFDEFSPVFENSEYCDERLHTAFNTLSHIISTYHKELWVKIDDIKRELDKKTVYDLAISFAGEDRDIAREIAGRVSELGYKVFYDEYEKANLWGKDLYSYLSEIYSEKAKFCLMIISQNYARKYWTNLERKAAQAKAFHEKQEYILPLKLDNTDIPGVLNTTGYLDFIKTSLEEIINLINIKISSF